MPRKKKIIEEDNSPKEIPNELKELDGIGPISVKKLNGVGVESLMDFALRSPHEISALLGDKDDIRAEKWCTEAKNKLGAQGTIPKMERTANEIYEYNMKTPRIFTRTLVDNLFIDKYSPTGGIDSGFLNEVYGEFGSGKTQFCHTVVVEGIQQRGLKVMWIDGENTFEPDRIINIAISRGYTETEQEARDKFLSNIIDIHVTDSTAVISVVNLLHRRVLNDGIKLIICDGLSGKFRQEYMGRGELSPRQDQLKIFMGRLTGIAEMLNVWVIMTNQVTANPDGFSEKFKPIGGNIVGHAVQRRIKLSKHGKVHIAEMVDSSRHPRSQERFFLNIAGIWDEEVFKKKKDIKELLAEVPLVDTTLLQENEQIPV
jgi:DNA repair protein RadA